jgi:hypothetical protein
MGSKGAPEAPGRLAGSTRQPGGFLTALGKLYLCRKQEVMAYSGRPQP